MESESMVIDVEKFNQLLQDVALIKQHLNDVSLIKEILVESHVDSEGELTDWAKTELEMSRKIPDTELIDSKEVKQMILAG